MIRLQFLGVEGLVWAMAAVSTPPLSPDSRAASLRPPRHVIAEPEESERGEGGDGEDAPVRSGRLAGGLGDS
jgi:hypothetical protein